MAKPSTVPLQDPPKKTVDPPVAFDRDAVVVDGDFDFSLEIVNFHLRIGGSLYLIIEADEESACKYRNAMLECTRLGATGRPSSVKNMADVEPLLVSLCLFKLTKQGLPDPVPLATIKQWPARIVKKLFEKTKELSELGEDEAELTVDEIEDKIAELERQLEEKRQSAKNGERITTRDGSE